MIHIMNLKWATPKEPWQVRVDRKSPLGNPYHMAGESQRDFVCDLYQQYFAYRFRTAEYTSFNKEYQRLAELYEKYGHLELFCWCAPKRCHAETIKFHLEQQIKSSNEITESRINSEYNDLA